MLYQSFAQLYDELMQPQLYDQWAEYVQENVAKDGVVLDLACGSGRLAVKLAQLGYDVVGADYSDAMLALADGHAQEAQVTVPLVEANMLDLSELGQFDTVTCFADSLCYLTDDGALPQAINQVFAHLKPGGTFLFDVITPYQTDVVYPGYMYNYEDEQQTFVWHSYAGEQAAHSVEHDLSFFVRQADDSYVRLRELHHERTYALKQYQQWLRQAGFTAVSVRADFGHAAITETTTRWFFSVKKPQEA